MHSRFAVSFRSAALLLSFALSSYVVSAQYCTSTAIRNILLSKHISGKDLFVDDHRIHFPEEVYMFYASAGFEPVWTNTMAAAMTNTAGNAWREGLLPADYHYDALKKYHSIKLRTEFMAASYELLLTDAFFTYAVHLWQGKSNPEVLFPGKWERSKQSIDLQELLWSSFAQENIDEKLYQLRPAWPGYNDLVKILESQYAANMTPCEPIAEGPDLKPGTLDLRVPPLRQRLGLPAAEDYLVYDSVLFAAVKNFQSVHGLQPDGVVGEQTLKILNESPEDVTNRIRANLERYRWLPREVGNKYVLVNIPDFSLQVIETDTTTMSMRAIVGRSDRSTPVFDAAIRYLELNPTWTVPPTILEEDVLPAVKKDINYLSRHNLTVVNKHGAEIDPTSLPWNSFTIKNFPYQLRQQPGPDNSMGTIKFMFPNRYRVFLHDTNAPYLFSQSFRALSSGCIRIEKPVELASHLLQSARWTPEKIRKEIESGKTRTIVLPQPIPFYLRYLTAFVEHGILQQRPDIYAIDEIVLQAIDMPYK